MNLSSPTQLLEQCQELCQVALLLLESVQKKQLSELKKQEARQREMVDQITQCCRNNPSWLSEQVKAKLMEFQLLNERYMKEISNSYALIQVDESKEK